MPSAFNLERAATDEIARAARAIPVPPRGEKVTFDVDKFSYNQWRDVWPDLRTFLRDPCTAILEGSIYRKRALESEADKAERLRIAKAREALAGEAAAAKKTRTHRW